MIQIDFKNNTVTWPGGQRGNFQHRHRGCVSATKDGDAVTFQRINDGVPEIGPPSSEELGCVNEAIGEAAQNASEPIPATTLLTTLKAREDWTELEAEILIAAAAPILERKAIPTYQSWSPA